MAITFGYYYHAAAVLFRAGGKKREEDTTTTLFLIPPGIPSITAASKYLSARTLHSRPPDMLRGGWINHLTPISWLQDKNKQRGKRGGGDIGIYET